MSEAVASPSSGHVPGAALRLLGDDRLARRAANGDREAFAVLYRRHHQALYRYCRAIVGNGEDAADALQNTMAAALRALPGDRREIHIKPWLFRIAHNESVSLLRRRAPHADLDAVEDVARAQDADPETRERLRQLVSDVRALPDRQRAALVMRELNGLGYGEIAAALEASEPATKQLVYEARTGLHEMAEGRDMPCDVVRRSLSVGDGRRLRSRKLRAHMAQCAGCREFHEAMNVRRHDFAAVTPALPALAAASLLQSIIGGSGGSAGGMLAGLASGGAAKVAAASAVSKGVATVAVAATVGAGAAGVTGNVPVQIEPKAPPAAPAQTPGETRGASGTAPNSPRTAARRRAGPSARNKGARRTGLVREDPLRGRPLGSGPKRVRGTAAQRRADAHRPQRGAPGDRQPKAAKPNKKTRPAMPVTAKPTPPKPTPPPPVRPRDPVAPPG